MASLFVYNVLHRRKGFTDMTPFLNKASITKGTSINKNEEGEKPGIG